MNTPHRYLVVDDDEIFRGRLVQALQDRKLCVEEAANADQALEILESFSPHRAVIDLKMPGKSGLSLVRELREISPETQIVVLTGYGSIATAVEAMNLGCVHYLSKPTDADSVIRSFEKDREAVKKLESSLHDSTPSLADVEREHIHRILHEHGGNISKAASALGIHRRSLQRKLKKTPPLS